MGFQLINIFKFVSISNTDRFNLYTWEVSEVLGNFQEGKGILRSKRLRPAGLEGPRVQEAGDLPNSRAPATPSCLEHQQELGTYGSHNLGHLTAVWLWGPSSPPPQQLQVAMGRRCAQGSKLTVSALPRGGDSQPRVATGNVGLKEVKQLEHGRTLDAAGCEPTHLVPEPGHSGYKPLLGPSTFTRLKPERQNLPRWGVWRAGQRTRSETATTPLARTPVGPPQAAKAADPPRPLPHRTSRTVFAPVSAPRRPPASSCSTSPPSCVFGFYWVQVLVRATNEARPDGCAHPGASPTPTPSSPRERRVSSAVAVTARPCLLRGRGLLRMTRKCFSIRWWWKGTTECWAVEVASLHGLQYAGITLSAPEGLDGESVPPALES